jgi:hypothetical protein
MKSQTLAPRHSGTTTMEAEHISEYKGIGRMADPRIPEALGARQQGEHG